MWEMHVSISQNIVESVTQINFPYGFCFIYKCTNENHVNYIRYDMQYFWKNSVQSNNNMGWIIYRTSNQLLWLLFLWTVKTYESMTMEELEENEDEFGEDDEAAIEMYRWGEVMQAGVFVKGFRKTVLLY